ncbi:hypothetical protein HY441_00430 [Candidatus Microgenomates bacterium]|nr:hypothetical protein [Candidatus Microgenomates bacterium]
MKIEINRSEPTIMHIDLNSCFAMLEQQANPLLRGKPVAITNRLTRGATIIAASYEAKSFGIGVGTKLNEAKQLCPNIIVLETDPPKYIYAHKVFHRIISSYSPIAYMKSIDEGIIDFANTRLVNRRPLVEIGQEIKSRLQEGLGEWITCNIGIAPNRFLAKLAASLHKPDGLDVISHRNLQPVYELLTLMDLPGINRRYQARLNIYGIFTPLDFLAANERLLKKQVFQSLNGYLWYLRLRGWEVDDVEFSTKTVGRQYVLHEWTNNNQKLAPILMKMCEGLGRRMRAKGFCARGLFVGSWFINGQYWYARQKFKTKLFTTQDLFARAWHLLSKRPSTTTIKALTVSAYGLLPAQDKQTILFETNDMRRWRLAEVVDDINNRFGEFSVMPAAMADTEHLVPEKIPFGTVKYFGG